MAKTPKLEAVTVERHLREQRGNTAAVGRILGVTRQAVAQFCRNRPKLAAVLTECREALLDDVESALFKAALKGEPWAVCFLLKTQGRKRGYFEKQEHTVVSEPPPPIEVVEVVPLAIEASPSDLSAAGEP
jgi:hypothetical protein